jgi:hypothetical protein
MNPLECKALQNLLAQLVEIHGAKRNREIADDDFVCTYADAGD